MKVQVKRHRGEPGHTWHTRAHTNTRITQTNLKVPSSQKGNPLRQKLFV